MRSPTAPLVLAVVITAFFVCLASVAMAQQDQGRWGIGLRGGPAIMTVSNSGDIGPIVSMNIFYNLTYYLSTGLDLHWETHDNFMLSNKELTTYSVMPYVELRGALWHPFVPYVSMGVGANFNSGVDDSKTTIAVKPAVGIDYFLTKKLALNAEAGWKLNAWRTELSGGGGNAHKAYVYLPLIGIRYYFDGP
jgi:hypothetical protein